MKRCVAHHCFMVVVQWFSAVYFDLLAELVHSHTPGTPLDLQQISYSNYNSVIVIKLSVKFNFTPSTHCMTCCPCKTGVCRNGSLTSSLGMHDHYLAKLGVGLILRY